MPVLSKSGSTDVNIQIKSQVGFATKECVLKSRQFTSIRKLLESEMPPIIFRNHPKFKELTGYSPRTLANEDSRGTGPSQRVVIGKNTGYPREPFLDWLESRSRWAKVGEESGNGNTDEVSTQ
ncbi:MAG: hypothetical protein CSYNP_04412 [Syntrophus sp. SKADARSKE-3]|nr:hypothetical protein [Syntrophus sp. SKADARSKE-3]